MHRPKISTRDLYDLCVKHDYMGGIWLIFPPRQNADSLWEQIARAVWNGHMGLSAKIATNRHTPDRSKKRGKEDGPVICIYTKDCSDLAVLQLVLFALRKLGIHDKLNYKADAVSHLDIFPNNKWKINCSFYRSAGCEIMPNF